jgi:hypothetical protein
VPRSLVQARQAACPGRLVYLQGQRGKGKIGSLRDFEHAQHHQSPHGDVSPEHQPAHAPARRLLRPACASAQTLARRSRVDRAGGAGLVARAAGAKVAGVAEPAGRRLEVGKPGRGQGGSVGAVKAGLLASQVPRAESVPRAATSSAAAQAFANPRRRETVGLPPLLTAHAACPLHWARCAPTPSSRWSHLPRPQTVQALAPATATLPGAHALHAIVVRSSSELAPHLGSTWRTSSCAPPTTLSTMGRLGVGRAPTPAGRDRERARAATRRGRCGACQLAAVSSNSTTRGPSAGARRSLPSGDASRRRAAEGLRSSTASQQALGGEPPRGSFSRGRWPHPARGASCRRRP